MRILKHSKLIRSVNESENDSKSKIDDINSTQKEPYQIYGNRKQSYGKDLVTKENQVLLLDHFP